MKRMYCLLAAVLMLSCLLLPVGASDQSGKCGDDLTWVLDQGVLTISGTGPMWDEYRGWPNLEIIKVVLEDGVTTVGSHAFENCANLREVYCADTVTLLGTRSFYGCTTLETIKLSENLKTIMNASFIECMSLESIEIPDSVTHIGTAAFRNCENLRKVKMSKNLETLQSNVFLYCLDLEEIELPATLKENGNGIFYTSGLTHLVVPACMTEITEYMFAQCPSLRYLYIHDTLEVVYENAFTSGNQRAQLWHVLYEGTQEQWNQINVRKYGYGWPPKNVHFNCTGEEMIVEYTEATACMNGGAVSFTCTICNETKTVNFSSLGHKWQEANCTSPKTCSECGETEGEALGHSYETEVKEATCTTDGCKEHTCTRCGEVKVTDVVTAPGHVYGEWVQIKEPTQKEEGLSRRECSVCGDQQEQKIEKLKASYGGIIVIAAVVVLAAAAGAVLIWKKKNPVTK